MFEIIAKGFFIGLFVSSPMGPINMLTIQRTLNYGRWYGFVTGLGAMLSDLTYALITIIGLNLVSGFIVKNESVIQITASVIIVAFGYIIFKSNPYKSSVSDILQRKISYLKGFVSSFLLTFSNASIVLVFIGLYARFSFNPLAGGWMTFVVGMGAFVLAALMWWLFITIFVSRLRRCFKYRGLIILNKIIGFVFMIIGVVGVLLSYFNYL